MPGFLGIQELVLLIALLTLIFGARRLPELGRSLGQGMREFKYGITGTRPDELDRGALDDRATLT